MRVSSDVEELRLAPGAGGSVTLEVVNTGTVIDGISARALGLSEQMVRTEPAMLSLFPEARGSLAVRVDLPANFPAGRHPVVLEVLSSAVDLTRHLNLDLVVEQRPALTLTAHPPVVRGRRKARFLIEVANRGNLALNVALTVSDAESNMSARPTPSSLVVPAGSVATSLLEVKGPRLLTGSEMDRSLRLRASGTDVSELPDGPVGEPVAPSEADPVAAGPSRSAALQSKLPGGLQSKLPAVLRRAPATPPVQPLDGVPVVGEPLAEDALPLIFRQRPLLSRGLLTALVLASIVALWALAFLFGIAKVLGSDPLTKTAPASLFASTPTSSGSGNGSGSGTGTGTGTAKGAAPAGAAPKSGLLPPGVGGVLSGKVVAASDGAPVGRIIVQAYRRGPSGIMPVASAATQSDGTYSVAGLFPGHYLLQFSASGFTTEWFPAATSSSTATTVSANPGQTTTVPTVTITGKPASLQGTVDFGDTLTQPTGKIVVSSLDSGGTANQVATASTGSGGSYTIPKLPAPGKYEVAVSATGYQVSTFTVSVNGGQQRYAPTVLLSAGTGSISGLVTDGTKPLGNVSVTTTVGTTTVAVATPTLGSVGTFTLGGLQTPATYVVTFARDGYGSRTVVVDLGPGEQRTGLNIALIGGTGTVSGRVLGPGGAGVGGATVTVGGASKPISTTTVTTGQVGLFALSGLPVPGTYTLTVTAPGLASQTVPVTLSGDTAPPSVTITMDASVGSITGTVSVPTGTSPGGVTITVTSGLHPVSTQTDPQGGFTVADLAPGTYAVTASGAGLSQQTAQVVVTAGAQAQVQLTLAAAG